MKRCRSREFSIFLMTKTLDKKLIFLENAPKLTYRNRNVKQKSQKFSGVTRWESHLQWEGRVRIEKGEWHWTLIVPQPRPPSAYDWLSVFFHEIV
jgi:hypothetical protein